MDCSLPGSSVHGISQARILSQARSGLPFPSPGDHSDPGIEPSSLALAGGFFTTEPPEVLLLAFIPRTVIASCSLSTYFQIAVCTLTFREFSYFLCGLSNVWKSHKFCRSCVFQRESIWKYWSHHIVFVNISILLAINSMFPSSVKFFH